MGDDSWKKQPLYASPATIARLAERIKEHALAHSIDSVAVSFHGGEPLLAGAEYFRDTVATFRNTFASDVMCSFGVQTNGTLITKEIIDVFASEEIHIGLSFDGPKSVNDRHRVHASGRGSFKEIMRGVDHLSTQKGAKIFRGILCVIDRESDPLEVFDFFAQFQPPSIDFLLPHGNWSSLPPGKRNGEEETVYADWLLRIFDAWFDGRHREIEIRTFEEIIEYKLGGNGRLENLGLSPVSLIGIAADGSIEGVDTLKSVFPGAHRLGLDIFRNSFDDALEHHMVRIRQSGIDALSAECIACDLVQTCGGGYFPHRWSRKKGFANPSVYCEDYKKMIAHIHRRVEQVVAGCKVR